MSSGEDIEFDEYDFDEYMASQLAIRDILYMYRELCRYRGLFEDFGWEDGEFDPFKFVDITEESGLSDDDIRLLREGSAIKILCDVLLGYGQGGYPSHKSEHMQRIEEAFKERRLRFVPELESALGLGLTSAEALYAESNQIFRKFVLGYLSRLAMNASG
jgi:hypothetical protein